MNPERHLTQPAADLPTDKLEGIDQLSARCFRAFHRAMRLHGRMLMRAMAAHGVHHGQAMCLRFLAGRDDLTQRDLARALHVSPPTVTKMVGSMERAGLVRRRPDAADARLVRVELTEAGRAQERVMYSVAGEFVDKSFGALSATERRDLARLLEKLADKFAALGGEMRADR
jgi:DNA-binding MarR family transcriptional regulator